MLEMLEDPKYKNVSTPSSDVLYVLNNLLSSDDKHAIAEVGVGIGATSIEIANWLSNTGEFHLYDFSKRTDSLKSDLNNLGFTNIYAHGNTEKKFDGYYWELAKAAIHAVNKGRQGVFDFVYLDGAHSYYQDAPSACALKYLIKPEGYLLFDDYKWSFENSPTLNPIVNPEIKELYTEEQLTTPHVELICTMFFDIDEKWKLVEVPESNGWRRLYQRIL